jgi:hypothetical protein
MSRQAGLRLDGFLSCKSWQKRLPLMVTGWSQWLELSGESAR